MEEEEFARAAAKLAALSAESERKNNKQGGAASSSSSNTYRTMTASASGESYLTQYSYIVNLILFYSQDVQVHPYISSNMNLIDLSIYESHISPIGPIDSPPITYLR